MLIRTPDGRVTTIDGRETAPATMKPDSFFENGTALSIADARWSGLSAGVPGTVATWDKALRKLRHLAAGPGAAGRHPGRARGLRDRPDVLRPDARCDEHHSDGRDRRLLRRHPVDREPVPRLRRHAARRRHASSATRTSPGPTSCSPASAPARSTTGRSPARWCRRPRTRRRRRPPTTRGGRASWRSPTLPATTRSSASRRTSTTAASTSGAWARRRAAARPSARCSTSSRATTCSADRVRAYHLFLEASRLAYADRGAYLADPAYFDVPLRGLLSDSFAAERRALITDQAKNAVVPPGDP